MLNATEHAIPGLGDRPRQLRGHRTDLAQAPVSLRGALGPNRGRHLRIGRLSGADRKSASSGVPPSHQPRTPSHQPQTPSHRRWPVLRDGRAGTNETRCAMAVPAGGNRLPANYRRCRLWQAFAQFAAACPGLPEPASDMTSPLGTVPGHRFDLQRQRLFWLEVLHLAGLHQPTLHRIGRERPRLALCGDAQKTAHGEARGVPPSLPAVRHGRQDHRSKPFRSSAVVPPGDAGRTQPHKLWCVVVLEEPSVDGDARPAFHTFTADHPAWRRRVLYGSLDRALPPSEFLRDPVHAPAAAVQPTRLGVPGSPFVWRGLAPSTQPSCAVSIGLRFLFCHGPTLSATGHLRAAVGRFPTAGGTCCGRRRRRSGVQPRAGSPSDMIEIAAPSRRDSATG